jgi:hypothetical protein
MTDWSVQLAQLHSVVARFVVLTAFVICFGCAPSGSSDSALLPSASAISRVDLSSDQTEEWLLLAAFNARDRVCGLSGGSAHTRRQCLLESVADRPLNGCDAAAVDLSDLSGMLREWATPASADATFVRVVRLRNSQCTSNGHQLEGGQSPAAPGPCEPNTVALRAMEQIARASINEDGRGVSRCVAVPSVRFLQEACHEVFLSQRHVQSPGWTPLGTEKLCSVLPL